MKFSEKVLSVQPSATLAITSKAKAMAQAGEDVIVLAAGEPDFDTPDIIKDAAIKAIRAGNTKYTPSSGTLSLKKMICRKLEKDNGLKYDPDEIVVSDGAKHSLFNIIQVLCIPGDEILIVHPYWLSYPEMVKLAGGIPRIIHTKKEDGFKVKAKDILSAITQRTKALIVNSPSNPAGVVYSESELREIAGICLDKGILLISDEIYEKIIFDANRHFSIAALSPEIKASTIVVNGVSKSYSMTGWRIGYAAGDKNIMKMVTTLQSHSTSNPCSISQAAAEAALSADLDGYMEKNRVMFQDRRNALMGYFSSCTRLKPLNPQGAFYLFCDISETGMDSLTFSNRLLADKKVAVIPGGPFGEDYFIRISFATDLATIKNGVDRIIDWVNSVV
ncbi:MAG: pyridoxal phosphate-dependent aminotransferase [Candidatus Omnitrophota bacterium]